MIDLLRTLLVVVGVTVWVLRLEYLVRDIVTIKQRERERAIDAQAKAEAIPADLLAATQAFGDSWARQQALDHLYDLYGKFHNWDQVRAAMAAGGGTL